MSKNDKAFRELYDAADRAGSVAAMGVVPEPMVVLAQGFGVEPKRWVVPDGPCGFAWITVSPGTSSFARWLKANSLAERAYGGGVQIWVSAYNQSMTRKEAYAHAFARVLGDGGIRCRAESRMD